jgi:hypothetical protein
MAMLVGGEWAQARKYFSLSDKHEQGQDLTMPARGIGLHALVVSENEALRLKADEKAFAGPAPRHARDSGSRGCRQREGGR